MDREPASPPSHIYQKTLEKLFASCFDWNDCRECEYREYCEEIWEVIYMWTERRWAIAIKLGKNNIEKI